MPRVSPLSQARHRGRHRVMGPHFRGRTSTDLQRQLLAPRPDIPPGIDLADLRALQAWLKKILLFLERAGRTIAPSVAYPAGSSAVISVGRRRFTESQARLDIVGHAPIESLDNR